MNEPVKKTVALYDDTIHIEFSNNARNRYVILETGSSPTGVTTMLSLLSKGEGLMLYPLYQGIEWLKKHKDDWEGAAKAYTIKSDKGKNVGSEVHKLIEDFLTIGNVLHPAGDASKPFVSFMDWFAATKPKVLATEQIIYSKEYDYAGTYDALLEIDGKVVLCDVKTTNNSRVAPHGIYPEMFLQLGAYAAAHKEEHPLEIIDDVMIIRVSKTGELNTLRASELGLKLDYLEDTFKHVVQAYKMIKPLQKILMEKKS